MEFDHQRALDLHAVEAYLLDELPRHLRESFEAHCFACPECAEALRTGLILQENARALLESEPRLGAAALRSVAYNASIRTANGSVYRQSGAFHWWRAWLRIPSLIPMAAAFLFLGLYLRQTLHNPPAIPVEMASSIRLLPQARDASERPSLFIGILHAVTLDVKSDGPYTWSLRTSQKGGQTAFQGTGDARRGELTLVLDARNLEPGDYEIALRLVGDRSPEEKLYQFTLKRTH